MDFFPGLLLCLAGLGTVHPDSCAFLEPLVFSWAPIRASTLNSLGTAVPFGVSLAHTLPE